MSQKDLDALKTTITNMMEQESETFRRINSDIKVHHFKCSEASVKAESMAELRKREAVDSNGKVLKSFVKIIDTEVPKMVKAMFSDIKPFFSTKCEIKKAGNAKSFTVVLTPIKQGTNVYTLIKDFKGKHQATIIEKIMNKIDVLNKPNKKGKSRKIQQLDETQKQFFNTGHEEGVSVAEQRVAAAQSAFFQFGTLSSLKGFPDLFEGLEILVMKDNYADIDEIHVSIESSRMNKSKGAKIEQPMVKKMKADLAKVLSKLNSKYWVDLKGSDSKLTKIRKKVLKPFVKLATGNPSIRTNIKVSKIDDSNSKSKRSRAKKKKVSLLPVYIDKLVNKTGRKKATHEQARSLYSYVTIINKQLPDAVRKNMNSPALENRTGRFANSVKLTDAMITPKGHPSFGYTYQTEPYGVFEKGTPERDPRKLIDASIREIAADMALGRFYTRRM